jgi:CRP-like cAMP-binding protein
MYAFATSERFARLEARDKDRLEALSKLDQFTAGAEILSSDKPADWLYLIADGDVQMRVHTTGGEVVLADLRAGDLFGELEGFARLPAGVRHVASVDTIVRAVPKSPLKQELRAHRQLASGLLSVYCRSISEKLRACNEVAARSSPNQGTSRPPPATLQSSGSGAVATGSQAAGDAPPPRENGPLGRPPHLSGEEAGWLSVLGQRLEVAAGERVVAEGDQSRSFYVVESGRLEVRKKIGAEERPLAQLADRDLFGFMAFVDGKPRSASVVAQTACVLTRVEADALEKALHLNFTVSFKFLGTLCGVLGRTLHDTVERVTLS